MKQIVTTDGSHTLQSERVNDTYHSINGAIAEANIVYIRNGLHYCFDRFSEDIHLLEVGFGTGLNALLTCLEAGKSNRHVFYYSLEPFPIMVDEALTLNYSELLSDKDGLFKKIHQSPWNEPIEITSDFTLIKIPESLQNVDLVYSEYHLIYFDAFGPDKQPELWDDSMLYKVASNTILNGVFTTYSTKGTVKRALKKNGFFIEKLPGPVGKREVLRAVKKSVPENFCSSDLK